MSNSAAGGPSPRQATIRDLVAVVFRQKWVILTIFGIATLSVFLLNLRTPTVYESTATVRVERGRKETTLRSDVRIFPWKEEISSEMETIRSYPVTRRAQEILDQAVAKGTLGEPVRMNRAGVSAGVIGESNVLQISYSSQDPTVCRPVTEALTEAYSEFRHQSLSFPGADPFFAQRIGEVEQDLADFETQKETFLSETGPSSSVSREEDVAYLLQTVENQIIGVERELDLQTRQLRNAETLLEADDVEAAYFTHLKRENLPVILQLRQQVINARLDRERLGAVMTPQHPELKKAEEALSSSRQILREEISSTVDLMRDEIREGENTRGHLQEKMAVLRAQLGDIPKKRVELDRIDNDIRLKREELKDLRGMQVLTQVNQATTPDFTVTVLSPAGPPEARKTRDLVRMSLTPLMSLIVGLLLAFFLDSLDHSLRSPYDVEEHLSLPVLASLPESRR